MPIGARSLAKQLPRYTDNYGGYKCDKRSS